MNKIYVARRRRNAIMMSLSFGATLVGLGWLVLILGVLLWEGFSGLSVAVFTEMTPPPGADGGLLNPIVGSLILTVLAVLIGESGLCGMTNLWCDSASAAIFFAPEMPPATQTQMRAYWAARRSSSIWNSWTPIRRSPVAIGMPIWLATSAIASKLSGRIGSS